jgi:hypothetical protein
MNTLTPKEYGKLKAERAQTYEISCPPWTEDAYSEDDIEAIINKYEGLK